MRDTRETARYSLGLLALLKLILLATSNRNIGRLRLYNYRDPWVLFPRDTRNNVRRGTTHRRVTPRYMNAMFGVRALQRRRAKRKHLIFYGP